MYPSIFACLALLITFNLFIIHMWKLSQKTLIFIRGNINNTPNFILWVDLKLCFCYFFFLLSLQFDLTH